MPIELSLDDLMNCTFNLENFIRDELQRRLNAIAAADEAKDLHELLYGVPGGQVPKGIIRGKLQCNAE